MYCFRTLFLAKVSLCSSAKSLSFHPVYFSSLAIHYVLGEIFSQELGLSPKIDYNLGDNREGWEEMGIFDYSNVNYSDTSNRASSPFHLAIAMKWSLFYSCLDG